MVDLKNIQDRVWANKVAKGFNTTNVEREFNLTYAEVAEAYEAYRKEKPDLDEELADVLLYITALAKMMDVDLEAAVLAKMEKNEKRVYKQVTSGHLRIEEKNNEQN